MKILIRIINKDGEGIVELPYNCEQISFKFGDEMNYHPKQGPCVSGTTDKISHVFDDNTNGDYAMEIFLK